MFTALKCDLELSAQARTLELDRDENRMNEILVSMTPAWAREYTSICIDVDDEVDDSKAKAQVQIPQAEAAEITISDEDGTPSDSVGSDRCVPSKTSMPLSDRDSSVHSKTYIALGESVFIHIDVDYFFAQVEEIRDSRLVGRPVGVQQNMEVASVNYEARAFGLFNRISVQEARRLCPEIVLVRGDNDVDGMQRYRSSSHAVLRCIMAAIDCLENTESAPSCSKQADRWHGRGIEHSSFDDFYIMFTPRMAAQHSVNAGVDAGEPLNVLAAASAWAAAVRQQVFDATGLRCSAGVARTKLLSMLATKKNKPNGQHSVEPGDEAALLDTARVDAVRGAGLVGLRPEVRESVIHKLGSGATVGQLRSMEAQLTTVLGSATADAVRALLINCNDGSHVSAFCLPQSLSVEISVRPTDFEPCTSLDGIRKGYSQLAPMLLSRGREDEQTFGARKIANLVAKWKLFPGAREVRQKQAPWPGSSLLVTPDSIASLAARLFASQHPTGTSFRVSRLVLVIQYVDDRVRVTRREGSEKKSENKQLSIWAAFKPKRQKV